jgi:hypothetical protein
MTRERRSFFTGKFLGRMKEKIYQVIMCFTKLRCALFLKNYKKYLRKFFPAFVLIGYFQASMVKTFLTLHLRPDQSGLWWIKKLKSL